jgi:hypothetical protein
LAGRGISFRHLMLGLLFGAIVLTACLMPAQSDTFWHLRAGQDFWQQHRVPLTERYSHTAPGSFWPNHEWLWQVASFALYRAGGFPLLLLAGAGLVTTAAALAYRLMIGPPLTRFALTLLGVPLGAAVWALRPQIASLALLAVLVTLLVRERYAWLPLLFVLWANLHGAVALGGLVLVAATAAAIFQARALAPHDQAARRRALTLLLVTPLCAAATGLTPLGFRLWTFIFESVARSRAAHIDEWSPAYPTHPLEIAFWILAAAFVALLIGRHRAVRAWPELALIAAAIAILPLAARASRNIAPFLLVAAPAASHLLGADFHLGRRPGTGTDVDHPRVNLALLIALLALGGAAVGKAWATSWPRLGWRPISDGALTALRTSCPGPLYNRYGDGGYLTWLAPERPVFLDSRQDPYPATFVLEALHIEDEGRYEDLFARHGIRCAFLSPDSPTTARLRAAGWQTRFADDRWTVLAAPPGTLRP